MGAECLSWKVVLVMLIVILIIYNYTVGGTEGMKALMYDGAGRPPHSGGPPIRLVQVQSGGIAGVNIVTTLTYEGEWSQGITNGEKKTGRIDPALARKVIQAAENAQPSRNQGACVDCFSYMVTLVYPETTRVRKIMDSSVIPSDLF